MLLGQICPNSYDLNESEIKASLLRSIVWSMYEDKQRVAWSQKIFYLVLMSLIGAEKHGLVYLAR